MNQGRGRKKIWLWVAAFVLIAGGAAAQETPPPSQGIDAGNYNIQNSIEVGWRYSNFTGNEANYDTMVNLHSGARLLNFSLGMRSLNHQGSFFDNLSLTGFGFGGDPNDVARLNISKNKWYNFDATFRRDKYFFGYNYLANPFNSAASGVPITFALHAIDYARNMSDFDLMLFPQSSIRLRLGYSRINEHGPSLITQGTGSTAPVAEPGANTFLFQPYSTSTDLYRAGIDFNFLPKTTLSYDQLVQHFKQDVSAVDNVANSLVPFQLSNGNPLDLGVVFLGGPPSCPTNGGCSSYLTYSRGGSPRLTLPTERFSFQTSYIPRLAMAGQFSYSSGEETVDNLRELWLGNNSRIAAQGSQSASLSKAKRVLINGDWSAVYQLTSKLRIVDTFNYNNFRLPGNYLFDTGNLYQTVGNGTSLLALTPNQSIPLDATTLGNNFASNCPAPYTAATCPKHATGSGPDLALGANLRYLGQEIRQNTFQFEYNFTPRWGGHLGYRYTNRKIHDFNALFYNQEIFLPGPNAAVAARGDCAVASDCTAGTGNLTGALIFQGFTSTSDTEHGLAADINGHSALFGLWGRPTNNFRTSVDVELFSADRSFTRITPRQLQHIRFRATYFPVHWVQLDGVGDIIQNRDNVAEVRDKEYNHNYSFAAAFSPNDRFAFDLGYNYNIIRTQALDCFQLNVAAGSPLPAPCPLEQPASDTLNAGALAIYRSTSHFANADVMFKPVKRLTFWVGYAGNFVRGTPSWVNQPQNNFLVIGNFLNPSTTWGPLRFDYQRPYVNMDLALTSHISYRAGWTYYGYNTHSPPDPTTIAPLGTQNFNGNLATFSVRYTL
jgi:hypothetical protein